MIAFGPPVLCAVALIAQAQWSASAGRETFDYRDVARSGPPVEASPVSWIGSGPSLVLTFDRVNHRRVHRFNVDVAIARSFTYAGPVRRTDASADDGAFRVEGRYEYRRHVFRDRFLRGLDPGIGVQIAWRRLSLSRRAGADMLRTASTGTGVAVVAAANFHRWRRWSADVAWTNGMMIMREHARHSVDPLSDVRLWGGGWLTDLSLSGAIRVSTHASVTASFLTTGEGAMVSHHNQTFGRRRFALGVSYAR